MSLRTTVVKCLFGLMALIISLPLFAADEGIRAVSTSVRAVSGDAGGIFFDGNFEIELSDQAKDVLSRGITLNFVLEVEVEKKRWYWFNRDIGEASESIRLSYSPLTRRYRVSIGGVTQNFETLSQALQLMSSVSNLYLSSYRDIDDGYKAQARFYLDTARLPKPFQVTLKREGGWDLDSGWFDVPIEPSGD